MEEPFGRGVFWLAEPCDSSVSLAPLLCWDTPIMNKLTLLGIGCSLMVTAALLGNRVSAQGEPIEVGVRATVPDKTHLWSHAKNKIEGDGGHGKVYGIYSVRLVNSGLDLVKKVDESYVTGVLMSELD